MASVVSRAGVFSVVALVSSLHSASLHANDPVARSARGDRTDKLSRARVVEIRPPSEGPVRLTRAMEGLEFEPGDIAPQGMPVVVYEFDDDATLARGASGAAAAGMGPIEADIFDEPFDSGVGYFGYLVASEIGNFHSFGMELGNWDGSGEISSYDVLVFNSSASGAPATVRISIWDGDPLGFIDTECASGGVPAAIPGSVVTFSDLPQAIGLCPSMEEGTIPQDVDPSGFTSDPAACAGLYRLKATLPTPVVLNCPMAWLTLELLDGCRLAWRIGDTDNGPDLGYGQYFEMLYSNVHTEGPTFCCNTGAPCVRANSASDCGHADFCTDGIVDSILYDLSNPVGFPPHFVSFVSTIRAPTTFVMKGVPVSADQKPEDNPVPDGWSIDGDTITLEGGGRPVWIEWHVTDWDPNEDNTRIHAWQVWLDASGYTSGDSGALAPYQPLCTENTDCAAVLGPRAECWDSVACGAGLVNNERADYIFRGVSETAGTDNSQPELRWGSFTTYELTNFRCEGGIVEGKVCDPLLCPDPDAPCSDPGSPTLRCNGIPSIISDGFCRRDHSDRYLASMAVYVPADAKGTFELTVRPPVWSGVWKPDHDAIPVMAIQPARIDVTCNRSVIAPLEAADREPVNRYLPIVPQNPGVQTALRVTFDELPPPWDAWNGVQMWVGPPRRYCENSGAGLEPSGGCPVAPGFAEPVFHASYLLCTPYYYDWHGRCVDGACVNGLRPGEACVTDADCSDVLNIFHAGIVPGLGSAGNEGDLIPARYTVQAIGASCETLNEHVYSPPLYVTTAKWGDASGSCGSGICPTLDNIVTVIDFTVARAKFRNLPGSLSQVYADYVGDATGAVPDQLTTTVDIVVLIDAFRGVKYPYAPGPPPCP